MLEENSSYLDTLETNGTSRPPESYRKYCIANLPAEYRATRRAYENLDLTNGTHRTSSLLECRTEAYFARNELTGLVKVISRACHLRWCPMCSSTRRWFLSQQVSQWLKTTAQPKFLTLTLKHNEAPLDAQIQFLYDSFRSYRKLNLLKRNIRGGVWFFQIHKAKSDKLWHPHLHCVIDSPWIDKYELSTAWEHVTKTSNIINIKEVKDSKTMSEYVARYAARPSLLKSLSVPEREELLLAMHGRRLVGTWGSARSITLRPGKPPDSDQWRNVGSYRQVIDTMDEDPKARTIWLSFKTSVECPEDCNLLAREIVKPILEEEWHTLALDSKWLHLDFQ